MIGSAPTSSHQWGAMTPGRSLGGGLTPGHAMRNAYNTPQLHYDDTPGAVIGGLNMGPTPRPKPAPDPFAFKMPDFASMFGKMGFNDDLPPPPSPHVTSSIPLGDLQREYLPDPVVKTGVAQGIGKMMQQANAQPMLEQYGANQGNQASAASGQYAPLVMSRMQDPLQGAAMSWDMPIQAALQHQDFQTKGMEAQSKEALGLAGEANNWYNDRLNTSQRKFGQKLDLGRLMMG